MTTTPTPPTTPALKPGEYWVQCPDGSWVVARVLNWWHAKNRKKPADASATHSHAHSVSYVTRTLI